MPADTVWPVSISIHAPREGSDNRIKTTIIRHKVFQSTLPVRGATCPACEDKQQEEFQSTLPVRGATHGQRGWDGV